MAVVRLFSYSAASTSAQLNDFTVCVGGSLKDRGFNTLDQVKVTSLHQSLEQDNVLVCKQPVEVDHWYNGNLVRLDVT
jgi:hypothetical protein